jgi:UDP-N-acetylmuramate dehydrogenase
MSPGRPEVAVPGHAAPAGGADPGAVHVAATCLEGIGALNGPLGALTTYRVGGAAALLVTARSVADLARVADAASASGLPVLVVGRGSNLLVSDAGFGGIAVLLDATGFGELDFERRVAVAVVRAGAALPLPALARRSVEAGVRGLEWAVGVPGSVGGGVRMNAGGHGSDMATSSVAATLVDLSGPAAGRARRIDAAELGFGYRRSSIGPATVVVAAELEARWGDPADGRELIRSIVGWRREHQPGGQNAGSVFVNPVTADPMATHVAATAPTAADPGAADPGAADPSAAEVESRCEPDVGGAVRTAGALVEQAGMKGCRLGSASVSAKHANFIQADPGGSADDVYRLVREVQARVAERFGVALRTEIRLVGFEPSSSTGGL